MSEGRAILAWAAILALAPQEAHAGGNPFRHPDPRWQIAATPCYSLVIGYDGVRRRGGGAGVGALYQLTSAFSLVAEARWHMVAPRPAETATQAVAFKLMLRYDLDVLEVRPYLAAGGTAVIFPAGYMRDVEVGEEAPPGSVGANWGPVIETGVDWRPVRWLVVGLVLDMGWLMRFAPLEGNPWPQIRSAGAHAGIYF
jgi:hypothetical protein